MQENPNFELICFGLPNMRSFYRAHMPKRFDDDISNVHGIQYVSKIKKRVSGFLLAKIGLYYRVTFPVMYEGKYIGLVAFGINLNYVNDYINEEFGTESAIVVDTKTLKQSKWFDMLEEGNIGKYTIISSNGELISELAKSGHNVDEKNLTFESNDKTFNVINTIDIEGIKGKPIAKVLLFQDISDDVKQYNLYVTLFLITAGLLVIILGYILVKTFNKFLTTIMSINKDLKDLNENLETKVSERTIDLQMANQNLKTLIDTQDNIVILTNGKEITFANKQFFRFLGYKNIENFKENHNCICELFIHNDRFFHLGKIREDQNWLDEIQKLPDSKQIVSLIGQDFEMYAFSVKVSKFDTETLIVTFSDISETILEHIELQEKTIHDKLTGAHNREFFEQNIQRLITQYHTDKSSLAIALLDIDHFKSVNDTYGHDVGDEVLIHFVQTVQKFSREDDIFIRWGGEEFILVLKVHSKEDLEKALEHLRKVIEIQDFPTVGQKTCSIGGSLYQEGEDIEKTIKRADEAVYEAKENGRNRVVVD